MSDRYDRNTNLSAYRDVEDLANFSSAQEIGDYRAERLKFSAPAAQFLIKQMWTSEAISVLDI